MMYLKHLTQCLVHDKQPIDVGFLKKIIIKGSFGHKGQKPDLN